MRSESHDRNEGLRRQIEGEWPKGGIGLNHIGTRTLETKRLILRRFVMEDAEDAFRNWFSDPEVPRFMRWQVHTDVAQTMEYLAQVIAGYEKPEFYRWAIAVKPGNRPVGAIAFFVANEWDCVAEVAYALGRQHWNRGIATEAMRRVLAYAFEEVGVNRMETYHSIRNPASGKVMQKAGMRCEGHARQKYKSKDGFEDCDLYAILADDWRAGAASSSS